MEASQFVSIFVAVIALSGSLYAVRDARSARRYTAQVAVIQRVLDSLDSAYLVLETPVGLAPSDPQGHVDHRFNAMTDVTDRWGYLFPESELAVIRDRIESLRLARGYLACQALGGKWSAKTPAITSGKAFDAEVHDLWEDVRRVLRVTQAEVGVRLRQLYDAPTTRR